MVTNSNKQIISALAVVSILVLLLFAGSTRPTSAIVRYGPDQLLGSQSVRSSHITQLTILDEDVSSSTQLSLFKIGQGTDGAIPFFSSTRLNATTTNLFISTSTQNVGLGTTTPAQKLSVHGNTLVSGTLSTGNLTATGTITLNGVAYTYPSADGSASQVLQTNGSGTLNWGSTSGDWQQLGDIQATAATSTFEVPVIARSRLKIFIYIASTTIADFTHIQFNGDQATNYSRFYNADNGTATKQQGQLTICVDCATTSTTSTRWIEFEVWNQSIGPKIVRGTAMAIPDGCGTCSPQLYEFGGVWNNSSQITSIDVHNYNTTYQIGSRVTVYGAKD